MNTDELTALVVAALEELKAQNIQVLDVSALTSVTDVMVIASGSSSRQVKALAAKVVEKSKHAKHQPLGIEGADVGDWVLVDLNDVVVHIMQPDIRDFYQLERLWNQVAENREGGDRDDAVKSEPDNDG